MVKLGVFMVTNLYPAIRRKAGFNNISVQIDKMLFHVRGKIAVYKPEIIFAIRQILNGLINNNFDEMLPIFTFSNVSKLFCI